MWKDLNGQAITCRPGESIEARVRRATSGNPFSWVSYWGMNQIQYTHFVYSIQTPLPDFFSQNIEYCAQHVLNCQDYRVELDPISVDNTLVANAEKAKKQVDEGRNGWYDTKYLAQNFPNEVENGGVAHAFSFGKSVDVSYSSEGSMGFASTQGKRDSMEDGHLASIVHMDGKQLPFHAVFDGHTGIACAEHARDNFVSVFEKWLKEPTIAFPDQTLRIFNAFNLACTEVDRSFLQKGPGTTAVMCLVVEDELWVANLGDSRAILVTPGHVEQLCLDQRAPMQENRELIEARGGFVTWDARVAHEKSLISVEPARCFGDHDLSGALAPIPEIARFTVPSNGHLVLACDGVFEAASSRQVGEHVQQSLNKGVPLGRIAAEIAISAYQAGSTDNITVLVVPLSHP